MYRLNYGNSFQVSASMPTLKIAIQAFDRQTEYSARIGQSDGSMYIEEYIGEGDWYPVRDSAIARARRGRS